MLSGARRRRARRAARNAWPSSLSLSCSHRVVVARGRPVGRRGRGPGLGLGGGMGGERAGVGAGGQRTHRRPSLFSRRNPRGISLPSWGGRTASRAGGAPHGARVQMRMRVGRPRATRPIFRAHCVPHGTPTSYPPPTTTADSPTWALSTPRRARRPRGRGTRLCRATGVPHDARAWSKGGGAGKAGACLCAGEWGGGACAGGVRHSGAACGRRPRQRASDRAPRPRCGAWRGRSTACAEGAQERVQLRPRLPAPPPPPTYGPM